MDTSDGHDREIETDDPEPEARGADGHGSNDPREISGQDPEHDAVARGAEVDLAPEEREEQGTSAAPHGGEIEDTTRPAEPEAGGSRVSVVDEAPPRPHAPEGVSEDEYKWHTYKVYPSGRPDAVEFIDTYKAFGRSHILRGLNMGLPEGMVSMILGPSGTGKSVCIKHMVGLLYPDEGDIMVNGESVPNMPDDELFDMR